jgi:DNA-binding response OmpR family regulator
VTKSDKKGKGSVKPAVSRGKNPSAARETEAGGVKRIALIEDDADIAYTIRLNLRKEKRYQVEHYISGIAALASLQEKRFDLIILDLNLPDIDGLALCRELRRADETRKVPIIMLTARVEERDKLLGFEIGADDYITKPFSMRELLARVHAQLRRVASFESSDEEVFEDGVLNVDRARFEVRLHGERVHLTKKEFDLLWLLIRSRGRVVTRDSILARLWDYDADVETRTVDVHIRSLRRKLGDERIETVVGLGYRYRDAASA